MEVLKRMFAKQLPKELITRLDQTPSLTKEAQSVEQLHNKSQ